MANPWRIELLGGLRLTRGEIVIERFRTRKIGALLGLLAYSQRAQTREALIEATWPGCSLESGRNNLRIALTMLRHALETQPDERGVWVRADRFLVELAPMETDIAELEALLRQAATATVTQRIPFLERALKLYRGPLLSGFYEDWIPAAADRTEALASAALETLIADLQARGANARALDWAHHGVAAGISTGKNHVERLKSGRENASPIALSPRKASAPPLFLSRFFGRQTELERIGEHLADAESWLLTLTGPGGGGKTRLLCEALTRRSETMVWIALEGLTDAARLDEALIAALSLTVPPARAPIDCVVETLQGEAPLLCFDNFEHLLPDGAVWLWQLKQRVPSLRCIATSRARLALEGEALLEIGTLELPAGDAPTEVVQSAAAALFLDRTRAVNPDFSRHHAQSADFARLLHQLDGLPLALELAAARTGILAPRQMSARLQNDADLPPARHRTPRHRSLSATLNWSLELLGNSERALLARLSVFHAPFDLAAICAVDTTEGDENCDENEILQRIEHLRNASLLRAVLPDRGAQSQRFTLLQTVRAGAWRLLNAHERRVVARAHALYCVQLAERAEADVRPGWERDIHLSAHWSDLSAALDWAVRTGEIQIGLRLASALWQFWSLGGRAREGLTHIEKLLDLSDDSLDKGTYLRGATVAGLLALQMGDYATGECYFSRVVERATNDPSHQRLLAWALNLRGTSAQRQGNYSAACAYLTQSLELYRDAPAHQRATSLTALAGALVSNGQIEAAQLRCREARVLWRALNNGPSLGWVEEIEGRAALWQGDLECARAHLENSVNARRASAGAALGAFDALGSLEQREGNFTQALVIYQTALTSARKLGFRPAIASALMGLGRAGNALGETEKARHSWQEALVLWHEIGDEVQAKICRELLKSQKNARP